MYTINNIQTSPLTIHLNRSVADPGSPVGGGRPPPTWVLFGKNICKNERIGSCFGGAPAAPLGSANVRLTHINITFIWKTRSRKSVDLSVYDLLRQSVQSITAEYRHIAEYPAYN